LPGIFAAVLLTAWAGSAAAQAGRVGGTVKDSGGQGIKGATISAEFLDANTDTVAATTDDKGRFAMIGLRFGNWTFYVYAPGYQGQSVTLHVRTVGINPPMVFALEKAVVPPSLVGTVGPRDLQGTLAAADALYNQQRWDDAVAAYRGVLVEAPALTAVHLQIAAALRNKKDFDGAITAYSALLAVEPDNDKAKLGIAMAQSDGGNLEAAEATLERAAQSDKASRDILLGLGDVRLARSHTDEAAAAYGRAAALDPNWGKPPLALGRMAMARGNREQARKYFETTVSVAPLSPEAGQATALLQQIGR
jgi:tetratricopeptide (TPR) repeat protein